VTFEWDEAKASANLAKHGVSFERLKSPLMIRSMLIFTIPNIPLMSLATLSLERRDKADC
jgi:hypothetical protein